MKAIYPGTFDPITNGHIDIIERVRVHVDLVVAVTQNPGKSPMFGLEERLGMAKEACSAFDNVEVDSFQGLLVDFAKQRGVGILVKGLRAVSDFDYELQMAQMNQRMAGVETVFMAASPAYSFLSSSIVKEVARFGGQIDGLVPPGVAVLLKERFGADA